MTINNMRKACALSVDTVPEHIGHVQVTLARSISYNPVSTVSMRKKIETRRLRTTVQYSSICTEHSRKYGKMQHSIRSTAETHRYFSIAQYPGQWVRRYMTWNNTPRKTTFLEVDALDTNVKLKKCW